MHNWKILENGINLIQNSATWCTWISRSSWRRYKMDNRYNNYLSPPFPSTPDFDNFANRRGSDQNRKKNQNVASISQPRLTYGFQPMQFDFGQPANRPPDIGFGQPAIHQPSARPDIDPDPTEDEGATCFSKLHKRVQDFSEETVMQGLGQMLSEDLPWFTRIVSTWAYHKSM